MIINENKPPMPKVLPGVRQRHYTIISSQTKGGKSQIANFLLNCEGKQYDIISNEALLIANDLNVKLLVAIMRYFVTPEDKVNRTLIELLYQKTAKKHGEKYTFFQKPLVEP